MTTPGPLPGRVDGAGLERLKALDKRVEGLRALPALYIPGRQEEPRSKEVELLEKKMQQVRLRLVTPPPRPPSPMVHYDPAKPLSPQEASRMSPGDIQRYGKEVALAVKREPNPDTQRYLVSIADVYTKTRAQTEVEDELQHKLKTMRCKVTEGLKRMKEYNLQVDRIHADSVKRIVEERHAELRQRREREQESQRQERARRKQAADLQEEAQRQQCVASELAEWERRLKEEERRVEEQERRLEERKRGLDQQKRQLENGERRLEERKRRLDQQECLHHEWLQEGWLDGVSPQRRLALEEHKESLRQEQRKRAKSPNDESSLFYFVGS